MRAMSFSRKVTVIATTRRYKQKWARRPTRKQKSPSGGSSKLTVWILPHPVHRGRARGGAHSTQRGLAVKHLIKGAVQEPASVLSRQGYVQGAKLQGCPSHCP